MLARGIEQNGIKTGWQAMIDEAAKWQPVDIEKELRK
jgi:hypothetical protein